MKIVFVSKMFEGTGHGLIDCDPDEYVMIVDLDRCISCGACELSCQLENRRGENFPTPVRRIRLAQQEDRDHERILSLPLSCRHCESPCEHETPYNFWIICPETAGKNDNSSMCDLCAERGESGLWPACATRCTMKTIYFGTAKDMLFVLREKKLREMGDVRIGC